MSENSLREIVKRQAARLKRAEVPSPGFEAQLIAAHALQWPREKVILRYDDEVSFETGVKIESLVDRRLRGEPMAYVRGEKEFWSMRFKVDRRVMIPRPDTEVLVDRCVRHVRERAGGGDVAAVDVGTGSGAIACAICMELPGAGVAAVDVSREALEVAAENVERLGFSDRICLVAGDLLGPFRFGGHFDVIAANLPYVTTGELAYLPRDIREFEPSLALDGGRGGLDVTGRFLYDAHRYARKGAIVAVEVEDTQVDDVSAMVRETGAYAETGVEADMAGFKRVVWAIRR